MEFLRKNKWWVIALIIIDLIWAFTQYFYQPIDGDLYAIVLPAEWYATVLNDPFGWQAITEGKTYGGAGRYMSHWVMHTYFSTVPFLLQWFVEPITSIYASIAIFKTAVHFGVLSALSAYLNRSWDYRKIDFWLAYVLFVPLLQTYGIYEKMGIIDHAATYVFFYGFPVLLTLLLWYPFYKFHMTDKAVSFELGWKGLLFIAAAFLLSFFGPIIQSLLLLISGLLFLHWVIQGFLFWRREGTLKWTFGTFSTSYPLYLIAVIIFALYAYVTGMYNVENVASLPLKETLKALFSGIQFHFVESWFFWVALLTLIPALWTISRNRTAKNARFLSFAFWSSAAILAYLVILPFGGYRSYRPMIYRYDLLIPFSLYLYFIWVAGIKLAFRQMGTSLKSVYKGIAILAGVLLFVSDLKVKTNAYHCERNYLEQLNQATEASLTLGGDCPIMGWDIDTEHYFTDFKVKLLRYWGIVDQDLRYIQKRD